MDRIKGSLKGFWNYRTLLQELVRRDIKVRYRGSFLGMVWTVLNPILTMLVMTVVFSKLFRFEIENYTVYFLAGNIIFTLMSESTTNALFSVVNNNSLIKKVYIPKYLFPLSKTLSGLVNLGFSFVALLVVMLIQRTPYRWTLLLSPIVMFYVLMFSIGLGLILATVMIFFRDIAQLYSVLILLWTYLTPIFYPVSLLEENAPFMLKYNPMYHYISYFRQLVLDGAVPGLRENFVCFAMALVMFVIGAVTFYKNQDKFILHI